MKGATTSAAFWAVGGDLNGISSVVGFGSYAFAANMSGCQTGTDISPLHCFTQVQLISVLEVFKLILYNQS